VHLLLVSLEPTLGEVGSLADWADIVFLTEMELGVELEILLL